MKYKLLLKKILNYNNWLWSIIFSLIGLIGIFNDFFIAQFFIVCALMILPPVSKYIKSIKSIKYNFVTKLVILVLSFALTIASPTVLTAKEGSKSNYKAINAIQEENTEKKVSHVTKDEITERKVTKKVLEKKQPTCDGTKVTTNCIVDGIEYLVYKYYSAVPEKSHIEIKTEYKTEIVGYCTLCNDGTRSPTCSTGRGTCSYHGGVKQENAPIYQKVPYSENVKIIDFPATDERFEKIKKNN